MLLLTSHSDHAATPAVHAGVTGAPAICFDQEAEPAAKATPLSYTTQHRRQRQVHASVKRNGPNPFLLSIPQHTSLAQQLTLSAPASLCCTSTWPDAPGVHWQPCFPPGSRTTPHTSSDHRLGSTPRSPRTCFLLSPLPCFTARTSRRVNSPSTAGTTPFRLQSVTSSTTS